MNQEAFARAVFILLSMSAAGAVHILWLRTKLSRRFDWPVDGGLRFRGRRLFGDNKRVCGFMVMPPAAAIFFMVLGNLRERLPDFVSQGLWMLSAGHYALLGLCCGLAFMLAELPNSFIKRQLDIAPGQAPTNPWLKPVILLMDRLDSVIGALLILSLLVPVSLATWLWVLLLGPVLHALFSIAMYALGIKARAL